MANKKDKKELELWREEVVSIIEGLAEEYAEDIDDDLCEEDLDIAISEKFCEDGDATFDIASLISSRIELMREEE